ncbi:hypothetical protein MYX76_09540 [Desulfobacterota bacterium AH_259_B03_O07]|nr:hypothetical protein [Desulfobacterota bacterium AH_259_B03_O07]
MQKYNVKVTFGGTFTYPVKAENGKEAEETAIEMFNADYDQNYEDFTQVFAEVNEAKQ